MVGFIFIIAAVVVLILSWKSTRIRKGFKIAITVICLLFIFWGFRGCFRSNSNGPTLRIGEIMSITEDNGAVTIQVKMPVWSDETKYLLIQESFDNVAQLIQKDGYNYCSSIHYEGYVQLETPEKVWDEKVIEFTILKDTIDGVYNGNIDADYLRNSAENYWVSDRITQ